MPESLGRKAAKEACGLLGELNGNVVGEWKDEDPRALLEENPDWFLSFTIILGVNLDPQFELSLSDLLWKASDNGEKSPDIPLITVRNSGFVGIVRTQYREHCIVDTHPDTLHTLRIDTPFEELKDYAMGLDMEIMDSMEHSHIPYVVLLVKCVEDWKIRHEGKNPTYDDLDELKELLAGYRKSLDEENFEEAESQAYRAVMASEIPSQVKELFEDVACKNISKESKNFWILLHALRRFTTLATSSSLLPISSSLPDMKASTTSYVTLQNIYKSRARHDVETFKRCLKEVLGEIGLDEGAVETEEVETFVRNAGGLMVCRGRKLRDAVEESVKKDEIVSELSQDSTSMAYYLALLGSEAFYTIHGRWPGEYGPSDDSGETVQEDLEGDTEAVLERVKELLKQVGWTEEIPDFVEDCVGEVCRGGASTIPTTAAFLGGVVAQEAIKLVTSQYVPLNNTAIVDLVKGGIDKFML